ncbi:MAG: hypothetical protein IPP42_06925 [Saprospiraceae bacterium]|nr:hypothetical protein [Saprospiraceae bacterium]
MRRIHRRAVFVSRSDDAVSDTGYVQNDFTAVLAALSVYSPMAENLGVGKPCEKTSIAGSKIQHRYPHYSVRVGSRGPKAFKDISEAPMAPG